MDRQNQEAWKDCSIEERIDCLSEYVLTRVDYSQTTASRDDIYQQTALVYLEAITNGGNDLSYRQMCNHCLNRVRYYLVQQKQECLDSEQEIDEYAYMALQDLVEMTSDDFIHTLDRILSELEKESYLRVWFDTYRSEIGIPISDPERATEIADLSKKPIESLWFDARKVLERSIESYVRNFGWLPESIEFSLVSERLKTIGKDSVFNSTFY
jgi:hypothetical protein